jgi:hypothetical protein
MWRRVHASWIRRSSVRHSVIHYPFRTCPGGHLGAGHDKWHQSFYNALQRPDGKGSCCNLTDCRPTSGRTVDDHYEVKVNGAWVSVPATKIIHRSAPDGGYHVCAPYNFRGNPEELYCVIVAPEG